MYILKNVLANKIRRRQKQDRKNKAPLYDGKEVKCCLGTIFHRFVRKSHCNQLLLLYFDLTPWILRILDLGMTI